MAEGGEEPAHLPHARPAGKRRGTRHQLDAVAHREMEAGIKAGNYQLALEWCEMALARYPSHPGFLRAKGSILLLMGEREKAIEVYEKVEEIESDPQVRKQLEELQKEGR